MFLYFWRNLLNIGFNLISCVCSDLVKSDDLFLNDDTSSVSSLNSFNYSNINYCSGYEEDFDSNLRGGGEPLPFAMTHKSTRFRPSEISISTNDHYKHYNSQRSSPRAHNCSKHQQQQPKLARIRSLVDVRSQLLHRSLVEEIQKRRLSKTVDAIETIGFQEPGEFSGKWDQCCWNKTRDFHVETV